MAARDPLAAFAFVVPAGIIGAHVLAVTEERGLRMPPVSELRFAWQGASSMYGGLVAGIATGTAYGLLRRLPLRRFLDGCAPAMALGEGITRIGCFLAGCCYGVETDSWLGVSFPRSCFAFAEQVGRGLVTESAERSLPVHPVQLYSAAFAFMLCGVLSHGLRRPSRIHGRTVYAFLVAYGSWRFVIAFLRADAGSPVIAGLAIQQLWSLAAILCGVVLWRRSQRDQPLALDDVGEDDAERPSNGRARCRAVAQRLAALSSRMPQRTRANTS